jgi:hypothetical protein
MRTPFDQIIDEIQDDPSQMARVWCGSQVYNGVPSPESEMGWLVLETRRGRVAIRIAKITSIEAVTQEYGP